MNNNQLRWGVALSYLTLIIQNLISILVTPIILRFIGQSEYGLFNLVSSTVAYMVVFDFGLGSAYVRFYSRIRNNQEKVKELNATFQLTYILVSLLTLIIGLSIYFNISSVFGTKLTLSELETSRNLVLFLTFNLFFTFLVSPISLFITSNEQFIFLRVSTIFQAILNPLVSLPLIFMGYGSLSLALGLLTSTLFLKGISVYFALFKLKMPFGKFKFNVLFFKEMITFSSYIFIGLIIEQLNFNIDKYILGRLYGTILVATYGIASMLNTYYMTFSTSIYVNYIPHINHLANENDDLMLSKLFLSIGRLQFMILSLIASGFVFFGREFLRLWAGDNYTDAYYIVILIMLPLTIPMIQNVGIAIQQAKNLHKFRTITYLSIAIINVIISIPLSLKFGAIGAAFGTAISIIIGDGLFMNWYFEKKLKLNIRSFWISIMLLSKALFIPILFGVLVVQKAGYLNVYSFFYNITIYTLIFLVSIWFFGANLEEKEIVLSFISTKLKNSTHQN